MAATLGTKGHGHDAADDLEPNAHADALRDAQLVDESIVINIANKLDPLRRPRRGPSVRRTVEASNVANAKDIFAARDPSPRNMPPSRAKEADHRLGVSAAALPGGVPIGTPLAQAIHGLVTGPVTAQVSQQAYKRQRIR